MEDLTKLSGPELAERMDDAYVAEEDLPAIVEAARRLREDTREWQRNLERERDGLRERAEFAERELSDAFGLPATIGPRAGEAKRVVDGLRASCDNQRKELHSLNVERKATLTKLEEAQRRVAELEAELREAQNAGADEWTADGVAVPEPAERKSQEGRRYGSGSSIRMTLAEMISQHEESPSWAKSTDVPAYHAYCHLRETLATLKAVDELVGDMDRTAAVMPQWYWISRLREVLNGKR